MFDNAVRSNFPGLRLEWLYRSIVGMRSGMIEVPGLLGIRTLYLEEEHNEQANRMVQWEQKDENTGVPGWKRHVVSTPRGSFSTCTGARTH
jgi:hypothetical protein